MTKVIKMFYTLKDAKTGEILESNVGGTEIAFVSGKGQVLEALENAVLNTQAGEELNLKLSPAEGVGEYDPGALQTLPKEQFAGIELAVGMELFGEGEDGATARVVVKEINDETVVVDFNHPYAGKELDFAIKISENREADADEALTGVPAGVHVCGCGGHDHDHGGCGDHGHSHGDCGGHGHGGGHHHHGGGCCGGAHHDEDGGGCCGRHH